MIKAGIKETRQNLTHYLRQVQKGEEIIITNRKEPIAKIVPIKKKIITRLQTHKDLRDSIIPRGKKLSEVVVEYRREERY